MRRTLFLLVALGVSMSARAEEEDMTLETMMNRASVARWEEHQPVTTAADAEAYAERLCASIYADRDEWRYQVPFHAVLEDDHWRVVGSRPLMEWPGWPMTGPMTIIIARSDGTVRDISFALPANMP